MGLQRWIGSFVVIFALVTFVPAKVTKVDARGVSQKIVFIHSNKNLPSYAALEDIRDLPDDISTKSLFNDFDIRQVRILVAGAPIVIGTEKIKPEKVIWLAKIHIHSQSDTQVVKLASHNMRFEPALKDTNGEWLPLEERKKRLLDYYASVDLSVPSLEDRVRPLLDQALHKSVIVGAGSSHSYQGQIQMSGGLAFIGPETQIRVIRRDDQGVIQEQGRVNIREGKFNIGVTDPHGTLEADLIGRNEQIIGHAELDLAQVRANKAVLKLKPVQKMGVIQLTSAYSFGSHKVEIANPQVFIDGFHSHLAQDDDGDFILPEFSAGSSFVARAEAKNYWGSLAVGLGQSPVEMRLFPNKTVKSLISLTTDEDIRTLSEQAVVWGQVVDSKGQPVAGAKVELAGDNSAIPVYFNSTIPDKNLHQTSVNGNFAFIKVSPGLHSIRALYQGQYQPAQTVPVENNYVSYVEMQVGELKTSQLKIHDAFEEDSVLGSVVHVVGADLDFEVGGNDSIRYPSGRGRMFVEVDAGNDYEPARFDLSRATHFFDFPMFRRDLIASLAARNRINIDPNLGGIAGIGAEDIFDVEILKAERPIAADVVYTDASGNSIFSRHGFAKGGFVVFNVPPGSVQILIKYASKKSVIMQTRYVDPDILDVVTFSKR